MEQLLLLPYGIIWFGIGIFIGYRSSTLSGLRDRIIPLLIGIGIAQLIYHFFIKRFF